MGNQRKDLKLVKIPLQPLVCKNLPLSESRSEHIIRKVLQRAIECNKIF